jgi:hypothetical protein
MRLLVPRMQSPFDLLPVAQSQCRCMVLIKHMHLVVHCTLLTCRVAICMLNELLCESKAR